MANLALTLLIISFGFTLNAKAQNFWDYTCKNVSPSLKRVLEKPNAYILKSEKNLFSGVPAMNPDGSVNAVIEIPAGCNDKWEVEKSGVLKWTIKNSKPRFVKYLNYVGNYGMVPQTLVSPKKGGDGDPLDILVLGPSLPRGSVVKTRVIGVLNALDKGKVDNKILAVWIDNTPHNPFAKIKHMKELPPGIKKIVKLWFENYKGPDKMKVKNFSGAKKARKMVLTAAADFKPPQTKPK